MNAESSKLIHRFNNQFLTLISTLEAMSTNIDDKEYIKAVLDEILLNKDEFHSTMNEIREKLKES